MNRSEYTITNEGDAPNVLETLRAMIPKRPLLFSEVLRLAELQAGRLNDVLGTGAVNIDQAITALPRMRVEYRKLPTSGLSFWDSSHWVIGINRDEPETRQRFTLLHEFKHILDHGATDRLFTDSRTRMREQQAEHVADYFAGCVLVPRRTLKRAWGDGIQHTAALAELFEVSPRAIEVRLAQVGLSDATRRCRPPSQSGDSTQTYHRALYPHRPAQGATA